VGMVESERDRLLDCLSEGDLSGERLDADEKVKEVGERSGGGDVGEFGSFVELDRLG
jgi:hypothetical protein